MSLRSSTCKLQSQHSTPWSPAKQQAVLQASKTVSPLLVGVHQLERAARCKHQPFSKPTHGVSLTRRCAPRHIQQERRAASPFQALAGLRFQCVASASTQLSRADEALHATAKQRCGPTTLHGPIDHCPQMLHAAATAIASGPAYSHSHHARMCH